ncbi:MAG: glycoside hydrolase [Candidatus Omnitrophica bacterium]|nr:glycoside hydrolase [Candidatus Omnitrophota bacterium]
MIELVECRKIYGDGKHNAFTDITRWKDCYYLCFRHGSSHVSLDGVLYVFSSPDLERWNKIAEFSLQGKDLRDPKFLPDDSRLSVCIAVRIDATDTAKDKIALMSSYDGEKWSKLVLVHPNLVYWRPRFWGGNWYVAAHHYESENHSGCFVELLASRNGETWRKVSRIYSGDGANETELWFYPDGKLLAAVRREKEPKEICLAVSVPPYTDWMKYETRVCLQGPAIGQIGNKVYLLGRHWKEWEKPRTLTLFEIQDCKKLIEVMSLPAGKHWDFSYASFLRVSPNETVVSYYSGHQDSGVDATSIFLARLKAKTEEEK